MVKNYVKISIASLLTAITCSAYAGVDVHIGIGVPAPVVVHPAPVYVSPPVYQSAQPVYVQRPIIMAPAPSYHHGWSAKDEKRWRKQNKKWHKEQHHRWRYGDYDD